MGGATIERARKLRETMPQSEKTLWRELKQFKPLGFHFRRQAPIGPYFADFICHGAKLAVEVDGHLHGQAVEHDQRRNLFFENEGYRVLRFANHDVTCNLEGVVETIRHALGFGAGAETPTPNPSHKGEGSEADDNVQNSFTRHLRSLGGPRPG